MPTNELIKIVGSFSHSIIFLSINSVAEITWSRVLQLSVASHQDNKRLQQIDSIRLVNEQKRNPRTNKINKREKERKENLTQHKHKGLSLSLSLSVCVCVCVCICDNHRVYLPGAKFQRLNGHECINTYRCINIRRKKKVKRIEGENEV